MLIPFILIIVGLVFFAKTVDFIDAETLNVLWPLLLVVLGVSMVSNNWFGHHCNERTCWRCTEVSFGGKQKKKK